MRHFLAPGLLLVACVGCSRMTVTYLRIENTQGLQPPACPIEVDPRVRVVDQETTTSAGGFVLHQKLVIDGPIKIVPSDTAPWVSPPRSSTRPADRE